MKRNSAELGLYLYEITKCAEHGLYDYKDYCRVTRALKFIDYTKKQMEKFRKLGLFKG